MASYGTGAQLPPTSPYVIYSTTDINGAAISFTVTFDSSQNLTGATTARDANCLYTHVYLGVGPDGTPDTSPNNFPIAAGTTPVSKSTLNKQGFTTLAQALAPQVTAGP